MSSPYLDGCPECVTNTELPWHLEAIPGATHATYTCADCGHQWTTDWAVENASEKRGNVQVTRGATWENKGEAKATYLAVRDPASDRTSPATKGGGW